MAAETRVLAIDGGGIRGLIPALVLAEIERCAGRSIADLFDLIAGTSTGGIIALALTKPAPEDPGKPAWSAETVVELYEQEGPKIFSRSILRWIRSLGGILDERYSADGLDSTLERFLGETRLGEALTDLLITAYETEGRDPFFFKSARARTDPDHDFAMSAAARATSSAPTFFEPLRLEAGAGARPLSLIDGGVVAVNPAMSAYAEILRDRPGADVLLVSLGTGQLTRPLSFREIKGWGQLQWARPILDVVFDGVSDAVDYELRQVLGGERYLRLQTMLTLASDDLDDASKSNLAALRRQGEQLIEERRRDLDELCERLTDGRSR